MLKVLRAIFILFLFVFPLTGNAQGIEQIVGQYRLSGGGLVIFENSRFMIAAYATLVEGNVEVQGKQVKLVSDELEEFVVYGRKNLAIEQGCRIMFNSFSDGRTYIGSLTADSLKCVQPVFNKDANGFSSPYVMNMPESKAFGVMAEHYEWDGYKFGLVHMFENKEQYNDFVAYYLRPRKKFVLTLDIVENGKALAATHDGETTTCEKEEIEEDVLRNYQNFMALKEKVGEDMFAQLQERKICFVNSAYCEYPSTIILDTTEYVPLNDVQGSYLRKDAFKENGDYDIGDPEDYHNQLCFYKYTKMEPRIREQFRGEINPEPIFTVTLKGRDEQE